MESEDQGARPLGGFCSGFPGLWESSEPFPLSVGPRLLDGLLRQERLLVLGGSATCGEGVAVAESGEDVTECSDAGWTLLIFSEEAPPPSP